MKRTGWIVIAVLLVILALNYKRIFVLIFLLLFITAHDPSPLAKVGSSQADKFREITDEAHLVFPPSSRVLESSKPKVLADPAWVVKVSVPDAAYPAFKQNVESLKSDDRNRSGGLMDRTPWWKPGATDLSKRTTPDDHTFVRVTSCREGNGWMVYVECDTE